MFKLIKKIIAITFVFSLLITNVIAEESQVKQQPIEEKAITTFASFELDKLAEAIELVEKTDTSIFIKDCQDAILASLKTAKDVFKNPNSQDEINSAEGDLLIKIKNAKVDYIKKLEKLVADASEITIIVQTYKLDIFTNNSFNHLKNTTTGAKFVLDQSMTNQKDAEGQVDKLMSALNNLEYIKDVSKSHIQLNREVNDLIERASNLKTSDYKLEGLREVAKAKDFATSNVNFMADANNKTIKNKLYVSKYRLDLALNNLQQLESNKLKLEAMILRVESLDLSLYEEVGQAELLAAIDKAKALLLSQVELLEKPGDSILNESQEDVAEEVVEAQYLEALSEIEDLLNKLVLKKTDEVASEKPQSPSNNQQGPNVVDSYIVDNTRIYVTIIIVSLGLVAVLLYLRAKKNKKD